MLFILIFVLFVLVVLYKLADGNVADSVGLGVVIDYFLERFIIGDVYFVIVWLIFISFLKWGVLGEFGLG